jgi:hypothetical protein
LSCPLCQDLRVVLRHLLALEWFQIIHNVQFADGQ